MVKAGVELHELLSQILQNSEFKVDYFLSGSHVEIEINSNQTIFEHEKLKSLLREFWHESSWVELLSKGGLFAEEIELEFLFVDSKLLCQINSLNTTKYGLNEFFELNEELHGLIIMELGTAKEEFDFENIRFNIQYQDNVFNQFEVYYDGELVNLKDEVVFTFKNYFEEFFKDSQYCVNQFSAWSFEFEDILFLSCSKSSIVELVKN
jgi:hypothetical protein